MDGYRRISRQRAFLMGLAILWVLPVHLTFTFPGGVLGLFFLPVRFLKTIGYGGVDIFLFLSGFGLYQSLAADSRAGAFYRRRLLRLLPSYIPAMLVWIAIHLLFRSITLPEALGNAFLVGWWFNLGKQLNWYTQAIFAFYLLAPLLFRCIRSPRRPKLVAVLLFTAAFAAGIPLIGRDQLLFASRLPVFLAGMYFGKAFVAERQMQRRFVAALYAAMAAGIIALAALWYYLPETTLWTYGLWWYPFLAITPGLCLLLASAADAAESTRAAWLVAGVSRIGACSYEIYLLHFIELQLLDWLLPANLFTRLLLILCSVVTGVLYKKAVDAARTRIRLPQ